MVRACPAALDAPLPKSLVAVPRLKDFQVRPLPLSPSLSLSLSLSPSLFLHLSLSISLSPSLSLHLILSAWSISLSLSANATPSDRAPLSQLQKQIAKGGFGSVWIARKISSGDLFVLKLMRRQEQRSMVRVQDLILKQHTSNFLVRGFYSFATKSHIALALEYMPGGDLGDPPPPLARCCFCATPSCLLLSRPVDLPELNNDAHVFPACPTHMPRRRHLDHTPLPNAFPLLLGGFPLPTFAGLMLYNIEHGFP